MHLRSIQTFGLFIALMLMLGLSIKSNIAHAQKNHSIALVAVMGDRVSVKIDGGSPLIMRIGQRVSDIQLLSINEHSASFQAPKGHVPARITVRLGQAPYRINATSADETPIAVTESRSASSGEIRLARSYNGHFYTSGTVNGESVSFMVDTGASLIALSLAQAEQLGINYKKGTVVRVNTAQGVARAYQITLNSVTIQGTTVRNIPALVVPGLSGDALLGQSYLTKFKMNIQGQTMILKANTY